MYDAMKAHVNAVLEEIRGAGLYKNERILATRQGATIGVGGKPVLNFCANNYLGLANLRPEADQHGQAARHVVRLPHVAARQQRECDGCSGDGEKRSRRYLR